MKKWISKVMSWAIALSMIMSLFSTLSVSGEPQLESSFEQQHQNGVFNFGSQQIVADEGENVKKNVEIYRESGLAGQAAVTLMATDVNAVYGRDYIIWYNEKPLDRIDGAFSLYDMMNGELSQQLDTEMFMETKSTAENEPESLLGLKKAVTTEKAGTQEAFDLRSAEAEILFEDGQETAEIVIEILDDNKSEFDEHFSLVLADSSAGAIGENSTLDVTICDDEAEPEVNISFESDRSESGKDVKLTRSGNLEDVSIVTVLQNDEPIGKVAFSPYQSVQTIDAEDGILTLTDFVGSTAGEICTMTVGDGKSVELMDSLSYEPPVANDSILILGADDFESRPNGNNYSWFEKRTEGNGVQKWYTDTYQNRFKHNCYATITTNKKYPSLLYSSIQTYGYTAVNTSSNHVGMAVSWDMDSCKNENSYASGDWEGDMNLNAYSAPLSIPITCNGQLYSSYFKNYVYHKGSKSGGETHLYNMIVHKRAFNINIVQPEGLEYAGSVDGAKIAPTPKNLLYEKKIPDLDRTINFSLEQHEGYGFRVVGYVLCRKTVDQKYEEIEATKTMCSRSDIDFTSDWVMDNAGYVDIVNNVPTFYIKPIIDKKQVSYEIIDTARGTIELSSGNEALYTGDRIYVSKIHPVEGCTLIGVKVNGYKSQTSSTAMFGAMLTESTGDTPFLYQIGRTLDGSTVDCDKYVFKPIFSNNLNNITVSVLPDDQGNENGKVSSRGLVVDSTHIIAGETYPMMAIPDEGYTAVWTTTNGKYYGNTYFHVAEECYVDNQINVAFEKLPTKQCTIQGTITRAKVTILDYDEASSDKIPVSDATLSVNGTLVETDENGKYSITFDAVEGVKYSTMIAYSGMSTVKTVTAGNDAKNDFVVPVFGTNIPYPYSITIMTEKDGISEINTNNDITLKIDSTIKAQIMLHTTDRYAVKGARFDLYDYNNALISSEYVNYGGGSTVVWSKEANSILSNSKLYVALDVTDNTLLQDSTLPSIDSGISFSDPPQTELSYVTVPDIEDAQQVSLSTRDIPLIGKLLPKVNLSNGSFLKQVKVDGDNYYLFAGYNDSSIAEPTSMAKKKEKYQKAYNEYKDKSEELDGKSLVDSHYIKNGSNYKPYVKFKLSYTTAEITDAAGKTTKKFFLREAEIYGGVDGSLSKTMYQITPIGIPAYVKFVFDFRLSVLNDTIAKNSDGIELKDIFSGNYDREYFIAAEKADVTLGAGMGFSGIVGMELSGTLGNKIVWEIPDKMGGKFNASARVTINALIFSSSWKLAETKNVYYGNKESLADKVFTSNREETENEALDYVFKGFALPDRSNAGNIIIGKMKENEDILTENSYYSAKPVLMDIGNGRMAIFTLADNGKLGSANFLSAAYSVFDNGIWSDFQYIDDMTPDTLDYELRVFDLGDRIAVTWLSTSEPLDANSTNMADVLHSMDIYTAFYDKESGTFENQAVVGGDKYAKSEQTVVKGDDGRIYIYYKSSQHDVAENESMPGLGIIEADEAFAYKVWDENTKQWTDDYTDQDQVYMQNVDLYDHERFVENVECGEITELLPFRSGSLFCEAVVVDADGDVNTLDDKAVYARVIDRNTLKVSECIRLSGVGTRSENIRIIYDKDGSPVITWMENERIMYAKGIICSADDFADEEELNQALYDNLPAVWDETHKILNVSASYSPQYLLRADTEIDGDYDVDMDEDNNLYVVWTAYDDSEVIKDRDYLTCELYGVSKRFEGDEGYGTPVKLTDYDERVGNPSVLIKDGSIYTAYTRYVLDADFEPVSKAVSLLTFDEKPYIDVTGLNASDTEPFPGETVKISAELKNVGLMSSNGFKVEFMANGVVFETKELADKMYSGDTVFVDCVYSVPEDFCGSEIKALVSEGDREISYETVKLNYEPKFRTNVVSAENIAGTDDYVIKYSVANTGNKMASTQVSLSAKRGASFDAYGRDVIKTQAANDLRPGETRDFTCILNITELDSIGGAEIFALTDENGENSSKYVMKKQVIKETPKKSHSSSGGAAVAEEEPVVVVDEWINPFTDVNVNDWYYGAVKEVCEKELMNGTSASLFSPYGDVTRAMFVTVLYRMEGEPAVGLCNFTDVEKGRYYEKAVTWANEKGIVNGVSKTEFAPDQNITREQMAAIIYRYVKNKGGDVAVNAKADVSVYKDAQLISEYAIPAVLYTTAKGIMRGNADGTFAPQKNSSRAETATVISRLI